jgi:hypothetical protein
MKLVILAALSGLVLASLAVLTASLDGGDQAGPAAASHNPGHVNCPPGSHGKPRYAGVGEQLQTAREAARNTRTLQERAITAR